MIRILKTVLSMSKSKSAAEKRISGLQRPIVAHIMKCLVSPDHQAARAWKKDIGIWYCEIRDIRLKPNFNRVGITMLEFAKLNGNVSA